MSVILYSFKEGIDTLREKLIIGKRYEFSDCLQKDKAFFVEWEEGFLDKIEQHPNSANCIVSNGSYYLYCREILPYNDVYDKLDYIVFNSKHSRLSVEKLEKIRDVLFNKNKNQS